ncbi:MAG TPA: ABC transporter substrate-binding protein [Candidatus Limnocylindrales bacterium]|jgi:NitT/TauT family transport system substrate-binding protein|nr:ABC transporter substrate-binding protein [Candidatus Limnocylindrales bacterium]
MRIRQLLGLAVAGLMLATACNMLPGSSPTPQAMTPVKLQLQWVTQAQFAGYFAALDQGFYEDEGLQVEILQGAVDIVPQQVVAQGAAEFGVAWLPKVLASIESGADLVNIAQPFQRSGTLQVAWADSGIDSPEDWRGKRVGTWGFGNEHELFAAMRKVGIDPENQSDVTIVSQDFSMDALLNNELDAAQAMTYNEYAQVLEKVNPETGQLYQPEDLTVISMEDAGTAMLQDGIFARGEWLSQPGNEDVAVRFLRASFRGWIWCRDNFEQCVDAVLEAGPTLGRGHQTWQLNEINALIWPSPNGIGIMDPTAYERTVQVAIEGQVITTEPPDGAYRTDLAQRAMDGLQGDTRGTNFQKRQVELTEGGN